MPTKQIRIDASNRKAVELILHQLHAQERTQALIEEVHRSKLSSGSSENPLMMQVNGIRYKIYPLSGLHWAIQFAQMGDNILVFHRCPCCRAGIYDDPTQAINELCQQCTVKELYSDQKESEISSDE